MSKFPEVSFSELPGVQFPEVDFERELERNQKGLSIRELLEKISLREEHQSEHHFGKEHHFGHHFEHHIGKNFTFPTHFGTLHHWRLKL